MTRKPPAHGSHSQTDQYTNCPMSYKLQRLDRVPQLQAVWFVQGTAAHAACEQWELSDRTADIEAEYLAAFDSELAALLAKHPDEPEWIRGGVKGLDRDIRERRAKGAAQVASYARWAVEQEWRVWTLPDETPALEVPFSIELGGKPVKGYIDAIWEWPDGSIEPVDLKTGTKQPETARQIGLYKVAIGQIFGEQVTQGRYLMLKDLSHKPIDVRRYTYEYLDELYGHVHRGIAAGAFPARPSGGCFTCTSKRSCVEAT